MNSAKTVNPNRSGTGIVLAVALLVVFLSSAVTLGRKVHASRVSGAAQTAAVGSLALQAATAAASEALVILGERANRPGDRLFEHLRQEAVPESIELTLDTPAAAALIRSDALTAGITLAAVRVILAPRNRSGFASYEHEGRVRVIAEALHAPTGTVRRLVRDHTLRVNLLTTPRPFDQATWLAVRGERLIDADANARIADAVETTENVRSTLAPALEAQVRDTVRRMNELLASAKQSGLAGDPEELARLFAPVNFPEAPRVGQSLDDPFHYFPREVALWSDDAAVPDLAWLHLAPRSDRLAAEVARTRDAALAALRSYERAHADYVAKLEAASGNDSVGPVLRAYFAWKDTLRPFAAALADASRARTALLESYREYQERLGEIAGDDRDKMLAEAVQLEAGALAERATHRFEGPDANEQALAFLARYMGPKAEAGRSLHAVVLVDNQGARPLNLDALRGADGRVTIRGKVTLAVTGAVALEDLVLGDPRADLCVVRAGGPLSVAGRVEASVIPCDELRARAGVTLSGNLILGGAFDPAGLHGALDNAGGRYFSGVSGGYRGAYTLATLAPWALHAFVERE